MKPLDRRSFLALSAAAAGGAIVPENARAEVSPTNYGDARAILYDATRCIGCRACGRACRAYQNLEQDPKEFEGVSFDMPTDLSPNDFMILQAYEGEPDAKTGQRRWSFIKKNCMHCNVPACVSACPVAALKKTDEGPVVYYEDRCIGCRYCMLACPYTVPRYEWLDRVPRVRKCDLNGACVKACPVQALVEGGRADLIAEGHRRIKESPDRYVDHVYGEHEAGGASYLILAGIPFEKLGLPDLPPMVRSSYADALMKGLPGWIIGLGLFLGGLYQMERRQRHTEARPHGEVES
jgi:Fe-S-cluster-containing dehydrogenase component